MAAQAVEDGTRRTLAPCIGITGGIGTGKSTVARAFEPCGARVLDADRIGHEVLREDVRVQQSLLRAFGDEVLGTDGLPDRKAIGARVFGNRNALETLNRIVHPPLLRRLRERIEALRRSPDVPLVVVDAALITEWGIESWFDLVVVVTAPPEKVRERLRAKGLSDEEIERRIASQLPEDERTRKAGFVICNDGEVGKMTTAVADVWKRLVLPR